MSGIVWIMSGNTKSSRFEGSFLTPPIFHVATRTLAFRSIKYRSSSSELSRPFPFRALNDPTKKLLRYNKKKQ